MKATDAEIAKWKKDFGEVFQIDVNMDQDNPDDIAYAYAKKPNLEVIQAAQQYYDNNGSMKANEVLYNYCIVKVDDRISNSDEARLGVMIQVAGLFQMKAAKIKKL